MARQLAFFERNLRRAKVYAGRTLRATVLARPRHPCLFMHMPKCGGTSIAEAIYATVPLGQGVAILDAVSTRRTAAILNFNRDDPLLCHEDLAHGAMVFALREQMMLQQMAWGSTVIHGHVLYSQRAETHFGAAYRLVTLLRDPAERMISNFRMMSRRKLIRQDLDAYLETPVARSHAQVYLRYLSGQTVVPDAEVPQKLELAKSRLSRFAIVGFLDDLPGFQSQYRATFGVALRISAYNQATGDKPDLTPQQRAKVDALCAPDQAIFDVARGLR